MISRSFSLVAGLLLIAFATDPAPAAAPATQPATRPVVRCAVIGGMMETNFWPALVERFEKETGIGVEVVASGPKDEIDKAFRRGGIDLISMHASDTIINLVADGLAADPQPWLRNDMLIAGPKNDPAGIKGETDALKALQKIAASKANFVIHSSLGAQEVLRAILDEGSITLDPAHTTVLFDDKQRRVLGVAAEKQAYTLVGRIPFRDGKLPNAGLEAMVQGDARLRRPFLVAVATPAHAATGRAAEARRLAAFLRSAETQAWIAGFGRGKLDDQPLFYPVQIAGPATRPAGILLTVEGQVSKPLSLDAASLAAMPQHDVKVKGRDGERAYSAIALRDILSAAGVQNALIMDPKADPKTKNANLRLAVVIQAADGYTATFSLAELLPELGNYPVWLAVRADGQPLPEREGPARLIVPDDQKPARAIRGITTIRVVDVSQVIGAN